MALSKIQRGMIADGAVQPQNLITTATYSVGSLNASSTVEASIGNITTVNADTVNANNVASTTVNATTVNGTNGAFSGRLNATSFTATNATVTNLTVTNGTIASLTASSANVGSLTVASAVANLTVTNLLSTNATITTVGATTANVGSLTVANAVSNLTVTNLQSSVATVSGLTATNITLTGQINSSGGFKVRTLRGSTATTIAYYNSSTGELTYGTIADIIPSAYDQDLNTTNVVRFAGMTATGITVGSGNVKFNDNTTQSTAWTGTVANSQITSVSTSKVTGLSLVGYTNKYTDLTGTPSLATVATSGSYNDLSNKPYIPNQSVDTTSSPTFQNLTVIGTMTTLNVTTENVTQENVQSITFANGTTQTTAWTGSYAVSTSTVVGLSKVGYTNNYNDLNNRPTDQLLFTTSTATFNSLIVQGIFTFSNIVGELAPNSVYATGNLYTQGDVRNEAGALYLFGHDGIYTKSTLYLQKNLLPSFGLQSNIDIGYITSRFDGIYAKTGNFTGTMYVGDLYPYRGGVNWAAADGNLGDAGRRWKNLYVSKIYTSTATIYFEDESGATTSTLSISSGTIAVNDQILVDQSVTYGSSPTFSTVTSVLAEMDHVTVGGTFVANTTTVQIYDYTMPTTVATTSGWAMTSDGSGAIEFQPAVLSTNITIDGGFANSVYTTFDYAIDGGGASA